MSNWCTRTCATVHSGLTEDVVVIGGLLELIHEVRRAAQAVEDGEFESSDAASRRAENIHETGPHALLAVPAKQNKKKKEKEKKKRERKKREGIQSVGTPGHIHGAKRNEATSSPPKNVLDLFLCDIQGVG